jgi:hypothetical protein
LATSRAWPPKPYMGIWGQKINKYNKINK